MGANVCTKANTFRKQIQNSDFVIIIENMDTKQLVNRRFIMTNNKNKKTNRKVMEIFQFLNNIFNHLFLSQFVNRHTKNEGINLY